MKKRRFLITLLLSSLLLAEPGGTGGGSGDKPPDMPSISEVTSKLDWVTSFTINLNALVTGALAVGNVPGAFKKAGKSISEMWHFSEHRAAYYAALDQYEKVKTTHPLLLKELEKGLERYNYRLTQLADVVNGSIREPSRGFEQIDGVLDPVYAKAKELERLVPEPEKTKLTGALERWTDFRDPMVLEDWVDRNLKALQSDSEGALWLEELRIARKEWAALNWSKKGSVLALDEYIKIHEPRLSAKHPEHDWIKQFKHVRNREMEASKRFLTDFASFVRGINNLPDLPNGIKVDENDKEKTRVPKMPILTKWTESEPGEFLYAGEHGMVPVLADELLEKFAKKKCNVVLDALGENIKVDRRRGTYSRLPGQGLRVVAPVMGVGVGFTALYMGFQGFMRNLRGEIAKPPVPIPPRGPARPQTPVERPPHPDEAPSP